MSMTGLSVIERLQIEVRALHGRVAAFEAWQREQDRRAAARPGEAEAGNGAAKVALPKWFVRVAREVAEVEEVARGLGVDPAAAWHAAPERARIIGALRGAGWSISRVARVLELSETAVKRVGRGVGSPRRHGGHGEGDET